MRKKTFSAIRQKNAHKFSTSSKPDEKKRQRMLEFLIKAVIQFTNLLSDRDN